MGLGVALALATKGEAETAEHGEEAAHGEDHAAEAAAEPVAENAVQAAMPPEDASLPQLSQDFDTVMRQCRSIAAVTELFGTALADARQVPLESLKLVANSGQVRTDMSAPERKSCLVEVELPTGPLQCKVDAVVRYPDGVVGAHVGARSRAVTCEGDPHFDEDSDPARAADAGPDGRPHA
jgi:hypothetical protein